MFGTDLFLSLKQRHLTEYTRFTLHEKADVAKPYITHEIHMIASILLKHIWQTYKDKEQCNHIL